MKKNKHHGKTRSACDTPGAGVFARLRQEPTAHKRWVPPLRLPARSPLTHLIVASLSAGVNTTAFAAANNITTNGRTDTTVTVSGSFTDITTTTVSGSNAFNAFSNFQVGAGNTVNLKLPTNTENLINLVDSQVQVDGTLNSLYSSGKVGGNVFFASPNGFVVGATGVVNVGKLAVSTPTAEFMSQVIDADGVIDGTKVTALMNGEAPRADGGLISIQGKVNALEGVDLQADTVSISGKVRAGATAQADIDRIAVNTSGVPLGSELVNEGGVIKIVADEVSLSGTLVADRAGALSDGGILITADGTVTLGTGATLSTRTVASGGDPASANSVGNSALVSIEAANIDLQSGSAILAQSTDAAYAAGDVTLKAVAADEQGSGQASASSAVTIAGTIKAKSISATADAKAESKYSNDLVDMATRTGTGALTGINLSTVAADADSSVTLGAGAALEASGDITLQATATRTASTPAINIASRAVGATAVLGELTGETRVEIASGASIKSGGTLDVSAKATNEINVSAYTIAKTSDVYFAGTLAVSQADVTTQANVAAGATVDAANVKVRSRNDNSFSTSAMAMANGDGVAGAAAAISDIDVHTTATLGANLAGEQATGNLTILSENYTSKNKTSASAATGSGAAVRVADAAAGKAGSFIQSKVGSAADTVGDKVDGNAQDPGSAVKVAAAVAVADVDLDAKAGIAANTRIEASGDVAVLAKLEDAGVRNNANSEINAQVDKGDGKIAVSAGVAVGQFSHTAEATIGDNVSINAARIGVGADATLPITLTWHKWEGLSSITSKLNTNLGLLNEVLTSYASASGSSSGLGLFGSVNYFDSDNNVRAWVGKGSTLTTTGSRDDWKTAYGDSQEWVWKETVELQARSLTETIDLAGNIAFLSPVSGTTSGSGGVSVGGGFNWVDHSATTLAGIGDGVSVTTSGLGVNATSDDRMYVVSPTSGSGGGFGGNGIVALSQITNVTRASISNEADITADAVVLDAAQGLSVWSVAGSLSREESAAVGIAVAVNDIDTDTKAYIGDNDEDSPTGTGTDGAKGTLTTDSLAVNAISDGMVGTFAVAGAMASSSDPNAKPGLIDRTKTKISGKVEGLRNSAASKMENLPLLNKLADKVRVAEKAPADTTQQTKPPFGIAVSGASSVNLSAMDTSALVDGVTVNSRSAGQSNVQVRAVTNTDLISGAGGAALAAAKNPSSKFSAGVAGAVAFNQIANSTYAGLKNATVGDAGKVEVQALSAGDQIAIGLGIAANTSSDQSTAASAAGSVSLSLTANTTKAELAGSTISGDGEGTDTLEVTAYDRARIANGGGTFAYGGRAGVGAAVSFAHIGNTTEAVIDGGQVSQLDSAGVAALSASRVVNAAAMGSYGSDTNSLSGSFVFTDVANTVRAGIRNGANVTTDGNVNVVASGVGRDDNLDALLTADRTSSEDVSFSLARGDAETPEAGQIIGDGRIGEDRGGEAIIGVAGLVAVGKNNVGLSFVGQDVRNVYEATIESATVNAGTGTVKVAAQDTAQIIGVAVGIGGATGKFAGMGSAVGNVTVNRVEARIGTDADGAGATSVTAANIDVQARNSAEIYAGAGNIAASKATAAGAAVAYNETTNTTRATVTDATLTAGSGKVSLDAASDSAIRALSASGAGAQDVAIGGSLNLNLITDSVQASLKDSTVTAGSLDVHARERDDTSGRKSSIWSLAGNVSGAGKVAVGGAVSVNTIVNTIGAEVDGSTLTVSGETAVNADAGSEIYSIAVAGGGAGKVAAGVSDSTNTVTNSVTAKLSNSSLTDAAGAGSLEVAASDRLSNADSGSRIWSLAGNVTGAGTAAVGLAASVNTVTNTLAADVADSTVTVDGAVKIDADSASEIKTMAVAGGGAGTASVQGSGTVNTIANSVRAKLAGGSISASGLDVHADERDDANGKRSSIWSLAGAAGGAGTASVGASVAVNTIANSLDAQIDGGTHTIAGATQVSADAGAEIMTMAVGGGGAGTVAAGASIATNTISNDVTARIANATITDGAGSTGSLAVAASDRLADGGNGTRIWALAGNAQGAGTAAVGVASAVNTIVNDLDASVVGTTVAIGGDAKVQADSASEIKSAAVAGGGAGTAAVNGSAAVNTLANTTGASVSGGSVTAGNLTVSARERDDAAGKRSSIWSLAGAVGGAGTAAVGAATAVNTIANNLDVLIDGTTINVGGGKVGATTEAGAEIKSAAASGGGAGTAAVTGAAAVNTIASQATAKVTNATVTAADLSVQAQDIKSDGSAGSSIWSLAGNVNGAGTASVGLAAAVNTIANTVEAGVSGSSLSVSAATTVDAKEKAEIKTLAADGGGAGQVAVGGSATVNNIANTTRAGISGSSSTGSANDTTIGAADTSSIQSVAGAVRVGGQGGVGAATSVNRIGNSVDAYLSGSNGSHYQARNVVLDAASEASIQTIAAGVAGGGQAGVAGSVATNILDTKVTARIDGGADVRAENNVGVLAENKDSIDVLAGAAGIGGANVGVALSTAVNVIDSQTQAYISGATTKVSALAQDATDTLTVNSGELVSTPGMGTTPEWDDFVPLNLQAGTKQVAGLAVNASSIQQVNTMSASAGVTVPNPKGSVGVGATANVGVLGGKTEAYIDGASINAANTGAGAGQDLDVTAGSHSYNSGYLAALAVSGDAAIGAGIGSVVVDRETRAYLNDASVSVRDDVLVDASASQGVRQMGAGGAGAIVGGAGTGLVTVLSGTTEAYAADTTIAADDLKLRADSKAGMNLMGGNVAIGAGAVAGAFVVGVSDNTTRAYVSGTRTNGTASSQLNVGGNLDVQAESDTKVWNLAVSGAGSLAVGVAGMAAVNVITNTTEATLDTVDVGQNGVRPSRIHVTAEDDVGVDSYGGAGAAGSGAMGAAANVTVSQSRTAAQVKSSKLATAGELKVSADSDLDIEHATVAASFGGAGLSGAASLILMGNGHTGDAMSELDAGGSGTLAKVSSLSSGDKTSETDALDADQRAAIDNQSVQDSKTALADKDATRAARLGASTTTLSAGEKTELNADNSYDLGSRFSGSDSDITQAAVTGSTVSAGSVKVEALDRSRSSNIAGAGAYGSYVGVGGAVAFTRLYNSVDASISGGSLSTGSLSLDAKALNGANGDAAVVTAAAGAVGSVGLGAAVADVRADNQVSASLAGSTASSGAIAVTADDQSKVKAEGYGANAGAAAVGVVVAKAEKASDVTASVGGTVSNGTTLEVTGSSSGSVSSKAIAAAGGLAFAGNGAAADAYERSIVRSYIADGASIKVSGSTDVEATAKPQTRAEAYGVAVSGGVAIGASVAKAEADADVAAYIGDGASVSAGNLNVLGRSLEPDAGQSAYAKAVGGSGGYLFGANATVADASSSNSVAAYVHDGASVTVPGAVKVAASNSSEQDAEALGIAVGIVAAGANVAGARSSASTDAHFDGHLNGQAAELSVTAAGEDDNFAKAVAGSGGVIAGHAATVSTSNTSTTKAELQRAGTDAGKTVKAGKVTVDAAHTARFNGEVDSVNAAVVGASAAIATHTVSTDTDAAVGAGADIETQHVAVTATDTLRKDWLGDYNVRAAGGGIAAGAAADSRTTVTQSTDASLGAGAALKVTGSRKDEHQFEIAAINDFEIRDKVKLDTGGVIAVAAASNKIDVTRSQANVGIGSNATLDSVGGINLYGRTHGRAEAQANAKTYGLAGAAQADSQALITASQNVSVGSGASLRADGEIRLGAGRAPDGTPNDIYATALTDTWNKAAAPITIISATGRVNESATIDLAAGSKLRGVTDITLLAEKGEIGGTGRYTGMDLYRKAAQEATNAVGKAVGAGEASWELTGGTSQTSGSSGVAVNGLVESGIQNEQYLTIGWNKDTNSHFVELVSDEGISYSISEQTLAQGLQARLDTLYNLRSEYAGNADAVTAYNLEIQRLEGQLRALTGSGGADFASRNVKVKFIDVAPILAAAGDIRIEGGSLTGAGRLVSPGDAKIEVINKTPYFLRVDDLTIPNDAGGRIRFNGSLVTDNAAINALNPGGGAAFTEVTTGLNSPEPTVLVKNTYDPSAAGSGAPAGAVAPDIYIDGDISNLQGTVTVQSVAGSVIADGVINAKTINLSAGRDFVLGYTEGFRHIGGSPEGLWNDIARKMETGEYFLCGDGANICQWGLVTNEFGMQVPGHVPVASRASRSSAGAMVAGNNVYISGRYLNINGTIQSGLPDWNLSIGNVDSKIAAAESAYRTRLAAGNTDPYFELANWSQGTDLNQMRNVRAWWNAEKDRIELDGIKVEGGYMELFGQIMNTGGGELKVLDGYGRINISNTSGRDLAVRDLDVGRGVEGTIKITDLGKRTANGKPLTTLYKRLGSDVSMWDSTTVDAYGNPTRLVKTFANTRTLSAADGYRPEAGQRYHWVTGETFTDYDKWHFEKASKTFFDLFPLGWLIPDNYSSSNPTWSWSNDGRSLAEGQYLKDLGNSQYDGYSYSKTSANTTDWTYGDWVKWDQCTDYFIWCVERTYYAEQTRWKGSKTFYTHSVDADHGIAISFIGNDAGLIDVKSNAGLLLGGLVHNPNGTTNLSGSRIERLTGDALIVSKDLGLNASFGIGTQQTAGAFDGLNLDVTGTLTAKTGSGDVRLKDVSGDLKINSIETGNGNVSVAAQNNLLLAGTAAANVIRGREIDLAATNGSIGTSAAVVNLDTAAGGLLTASAGGGIYVKETSGDLRLNTVHGGGNVYAEAADGRIVDGNRNDVSDTRAETQLLALWDDMDLMGEAADLAAEQGVTAYAQARQNEYRQYWRMRKARKDGNGNWIADAYAADYRFAFSAEEAALLKQQNGLTDADLAALAQSKTDDYHRLHGDFGGLGGYDPSFTYAVSAAEQTDLTQGAAWTLNQLKYSVSKGAFSGTADTETRIETANVKGRDVTLVANQGAIGSTLADNVVIDFSAGVTGLTDAQRIALASAERDDVSFNGDIITIVQRDDVDVQASGGITAMARDELFLGGEQDINVSDIRSPIIRIKAGQSIVDTQAGTPAIRGSDVILEASNGSIGSGGNALDVAVTGQLTARAQQDVDLAQHGGNLIIDRLFANGTASLNVASGGLGQLNTDGVTLTAASLNLTTSGSVGSTASAVSVQLAPSGSLKASTGGDLYITSPAGALALNTSQIGGQAGVSSAGSLSLIGNVQTGGDGRYSAGADMVFADGVKLGSTTGGIAIGADNVAMGTGSQAEAGAAVTVNAQGDVTVAQLTGHQANGTAIRIDAAGRILGDGGSDLSADAAGGTVVLRAGQGIGSAAQALGVSAPVLDAVTAAGDVNLKLLADTQASQISSGSGALKIVADGRLGYGSIAATGDVDLSAAGSLTGTTLRSSAGAASVQAASAELASVESAGSVAVSTTGVQTLGSVTSGGTQTLTAGAGLTAGTLTTTAGDLLVQAGSADLGSGRIGGSASLRTSGDQTVGSLSSGGRQTLDADGDVQYTTLSGGENLVATVDGQLRGGSAGFTGSAAIAAGSADLQYLQTGADISVTAAADLAFDTLIAGTDASLSSGGALSGNSLATGGNAQAVAAGSLQLQSAEVQGALNLRSDSAMTAGILTSGGSQSLAAAAALTVGTVTTTVGDLTVQAGGADLTTGQIGGSVAVTTTGDQTLGTVSSTGGQTLVAGAALTAGTLSTRGGDLDVQAASLDLTRGQIDGNAALSTAGAQAIGSLATTGDQSLSAGTQLTAAQLDADGHLQASARNANIAGATVGGGVRIDTTAHQVLGSIVSAADQSLSAGGDIDFTDLSSGDELTADAAGAIRGGAATAVNRLSLDAGTDLSAQAVSSTGAGVGTHSGQASRLQTVSAATSGEFTSGGDFTVTRADSGSSQRYLIGGLLDASEVHAGTSLEVSAANTVLGTAEAGTTASLRTSGDQAIGSLSSGGRQTLDADGDVQYTTLSGGENLVATVDGQLRGGSAGFTGSAAIAAGSADLQRLQTGAGIEVTAAGELAIDQVVAGTTLSSTSGGGTTFGSAESAGEQRLQAGGLLTAGLLSSRSGAIVIGSGAAPTGAVSIVTATAATDFTATTAGDQTLGRVTTGADQTLSAGGTVNAGTLSGRNLQVDAKALVLDTGAFGGNADAATAGGQQIGSLSTGGNIHLVSAAGGNGDIVYGSLESGAPQPVGEQEQRLAAPSISVEADGELRRLTADSGDALAEGMLTMKAHTFDVGDLKSAGADVVLEAAVDVQADSAHAKRDLKISAGNDMRIGSVDYGGQLSLFAGRNLWAKVGGDIAFAVAEVGGNAELYSGGEIAFDSLKAGGVVTLDAARDVTVTGGIEAGEAIAIRSGATVTAGALTSTGGPIAVEAAGSVALGSTASAGDQSIAAGGELSFNGLQTDGKLQVQAQGALSGGTMAAGGAARVEARRMDFVALDAGADAALQAGGEIRAQRVSSPQGALSVNAGSVFIDRVVAVTGQLDAVDQLHLGSVRIGERLDLAAREVVADVTQTKPADPLLMTLTGHAGGIADRASLTVTSSSELLYSRLYGKQVSLKTSSERVTVDDAYVPGRLVMETPVALVVADNSSVAPAKGANVQLHEQDYRFRLKQQGKHTDTNAYVLRYDAGYTVRVPNFSAEHVDGGPQVEAESALIFAERSGHSQRESGSGFSPGDFLLPQGQVNLAAAFVPAPAPVALPAAPAVNFSISGSGESATPQPSLPTPGERDAGASGQASAQSGAAGSSAESEEE